MKQTAAVSLGILGLNEDFVQLNEIMAYLIFIPFGPGKSLPKWS
jgi:hypothetical protein